MVQHCKSRNVITTLLIGTEKGVQVKFDPPDRQPPRRIILHLPRTRRLIKAIDGIEVILRPDQKRRWDFPTIVELYRQRAVRLN